MYGYGVIGGIALIIKNGSSLKCAVGIKGEEGIIIFPVYEVIGDGAVFIRIGRIEFANNRTDWLVFGKCEYGGGIEIGGCLVHIPQSETETHVLAAGTGGFEGGPVR